MKIKSLVVTVVLATTILCFGIVACAQTTDVAALIAQLQAQVQALMQQIAQLQTTTTVNTAGLASTGTKSLSGTWTDFNDIINQYSSPKNYQAPICNYGTIIKGVCLPSFTQAENDDIRVNLFIDNPIAFKGDTVKIKITITNKQNKNIYLSENIPATFASADSKIYLNGGLINSISGTKPCSGTLNPKDATCLISGDSFSFPDKQMSPNSIISLSANIKVLGSVTNIEDIYFFKANPSAFHGIARILPEIYSQIIFSDSQQQCTQGSKSMYGLKGACCNNVFYTDADYCSYSDYVKDYALPSIQKAGYPDKIDYNSMLTQLNAYLKQNLNYLYRGMVLRNQLSNLIKVENNKQYVYNIIQVENNSCPSDLPTQAYFLNYINANVIKPSGLNFSIAFKKINFKYPLTEPTEAGLGRLINFYIQSGDIKPDNYSRFIFCINGDVYSQIFVGADSYDHSNLFLGDNQQFLSLALNSGVAGSGSIAPTLFYHEIFHNFNATDLYFNNDDFYRFQGDPYATSVTPNIEQFRLSDFQKANMGWLDLNQNNITDILENNNTTCIPNWTCGTWSICKNNQQNRTCTDTNNCGVATGQPATTQACTVTQPTITVTSPNGGETWQLGKSYNITWTSTGLDPNLSVNFSLNGGGYGTAVFSDRTIKVGDGKMTISVLGSTNGTANIRPANDYKILIAPQSNVTYDYSDNNFSIVASTTQPSVTITSPNGGETWTEGKTYNITWASSGVNNIRVALLDSGNNICFLNNKNPISAAQNMLTFTINTCLDNASSQIVNVNPGNYRVMLTDTASSATDLSDNYFSIVAPTTCIPNWLCGNWSTCTNGKQTMTCTDANNCGVTTGEPPTSQSCTTTTCNAQNQCVVGGGGAVCNPIHNSTGGATNSDCSSTQPSITVTFWTDKTSYNIGNTITYSAKVVNSDGTIFKPQAGSDVLFTTIKPGTTAPIGADSMIYNSVSGNYEVKKNPIPSTITTGIWTAYAWAVQNGLSVAKSSQIIYTISSTLGVSPNINDQLLASISDVLKIITQEIQSLISH